MVEGSVKHQDIDTVSASPQEKLPKEKRKLLKGGMGLAAASGDEQTAQLVGHGGGGAGGTGFRARQAAPAPSLDCGPAPPGPPQREVPGEQLSHQEPELEAEPQLEPEPAGKWVLSNYDFQARNSSELSVKQQDVLEVLDDRRKWWKVRDQQGQEGYVPYNILTPHRGPQRDHIQSLAGCVEHSTPPPPPAPAPAPAPARPHWDSCDSLNNLDPSEKEKFSQMLSVNEELQARLAQGRTSPSRATQGPRALEPQLSPHSDAGKVRAWLQAKGFSPGTVNALGVLSGAQLFSLQKEELRAVSPEEGARVYSQLTVQRALLEVSRGAQVWAQTEPGTRRRGLGHQGPDFHPTLQDKEKVSELEAVMEKQKKKVEGEMKTEVI
ncbi:Epidermal growth factor receptor kinase substrate 8-like protein 1 [Sciurus carolinensis]|uniref:Epidermal growth factor receptor kinase substrate 8-like protein 1 n=1 Tax=Sciurus carolinensis TaxID=30640 RepID=A0AA41MG97_SCICA|nr:Epidermal growth factor receptor kinase substrate 8-like protein 1 [Sciurus carolinensis]